MLISAGAFVNSDGFCGKPVVLALKNADFPTFVLLIKAGAVCPSVLLVSGSVFEAYINQKCYLKIREIY